MGKDNNHENLPLSRAQASVQKYGGDAIDLGILSLLEGTSKHRRIPRCVILRECLILPNLGRRFQYEGVGEKELDSLIARDLVASNLVMTCSDGNAPPISLFKLYLTEHGRQKLSFLRWQQKTEKLIGSLQILMAFNSILLGLILLSLWVQ